MLSDEEKAVLKTAKENYGLTSAEQKILVNLIEKQSKEIEELKNTRSIFNMGRRSYKNEIEDRIKAKIEELDKQEKEVLKGTKGQDRYAIKQEYMHKRSALQSLLDKE